MRKLAFFGVAAAALMGASQANAESGYVGAIYGQADSGADTVDIHGAELSVGGANFEADLLWTDSSEPGVEGSFSGAGHYFSRNDNSLVGGFVGFVNSADNLALTAGGEGAMYMDNVTLTGSVAYLWSEDLDTDGYGINGEGRLFVSDNFRLQAGAGYASVDIAGFDDNIVTYGVGGEYQLDATPISFALNFRHVELSDLDVESESATLSLRYSFGGSLKERDRSGGSQSSLVNFGLGL